MREARFELWPPRSLMRAAPVRLVSFLRERNPASCLVVAPSRPVAERLVQEVLSYDVGAAAAGLRATTFPELARAMAEPLTDRWILPPHGDRVIVAQLLVEDAGPYGDLALGTGLSAAVARTLRDLRDSGLETFEASKVLEDLGRDEAYRLQHLERLFARYTKHLDDKELLDDAALYRLAAEGRPPGAPSELLVYGLYDLTGVQRALLASLARTMSVTWLCPLPPDDSPAAELVGELVEWAESQGFDPSRAIEPAEPGPDPRVLAAPGERAEAREIAREILRAVGEGVPFAEMAVLLGGGSRQESVFRDVFRKARIPLVGRDRRRLVDRPRGRALFAALALARGRGGPDEVAAVLEARLRARGESEELLTRVPRLLRQAGCGEPEPKRWRKRLARLARGFAREAERVLETDPARAAVLSEERALAESLAELAEEILARLGEFGRSFIEGGPQASWSKVSSTLIELASGLDLRPNTSQGVSDPLYARAEKAARMLAGWDRLGVAPLPELALELWQLHISEGDDEPGDEDSLEGRRLGEGVLLLDANRARGLSQTAVFVAGLTEEGFAPPGLGDPLLEDGMRRRIRVATGSPLAPAASR